MATINGKPASQYDAEFVMQMSKKALRLNRKAFLLSRQGGSAEEVAKLREQANKAQVAYLAIMVKYS